MQPWMWVVLVVAAYLLLVEAFILLNRVGDWLFERNARWDEPQRTSEQICYDAGRRFRRLWRR